MALVGCCLPLLADHPGPSPDHRPAPDPATRCAALIAIFDDIIIDRFDYRILMLEDYELAEAQKWRDRAEADCTAGRYDFGIGLIRSALRRIGVVPPAKGQPPQD